ncbi:MAG: purine-nucleoside phosphorylase [Alphaproteobacteria bacterium]
MSATALSHEAIAEIRRRAGAVAPRLGLVLGSGLGPVAEAVSEAVAIPYGEIPGFPRPSVQGHDGRLVLGRLGGLPVAVLQGRAHYYESGRADAMRTPLATLAGLGCEMLLLTNAAGSLRRSVGPGSLMLIADHINFGAPNPLIGLTDGSQFLDMSAAYDPALRQTFLEAAAGLDLTLPTGTYMWFSGPSFETPAEIRAAGVLGADAVGMSTVPEAILARHAGLRVAAISIITNLAAGMDEAELSHETTMAIAAQSAETARRLITAFCERTARESSVARGGT